MTTCGHGTSARYCHGPDQHGNSGKGCRCDDCRAASTRAVSHRRRMIAYGRWTPPFTDAEPARRHVQALGRAGLGKVRAAQLAGVPAATVSRLLYGDGGRPPSRHIRAETAAALLAVRLPRTPAGVCGGMLVDAAGTRRRIQALAVAGWSWQRLAERLGKDRSKLRLILRRDRVTAETARAVAGLYDELWDRRPPEGTVGERCSVSRTRNAACRRGWVPAGAWDDDPWDYAAGRPSSHWIEDPHAQPAPWQHRPGLRAPADSPAGTGDAA